LQAATMAAKNHDLVILCGSLYLLGHFLTQESFSPNTEGQPGR
jgi:folylpolyglutamate synthase/dihydropteroate synthase